MARRRGRVARLPKDIREVVSIKLQDGVPYSNIADWLGEKGHTGINEDHIRAWYQGGYGDWLHAQERLMQVHSKRDAARQVTESNEPGVFEAANSELASSQVFEGLNAYQPELLIQALNEKPELYIKLLNTFIRLNKETLSRRNAQLRWAQLKEKEKETVPGPKELSAETIRKMQGHLGWKPTSEPEQQKPEESNGVNGSQRELPGAGES